MTMYEKTISKAGISDYDARNAFLVTYKKKQYVVYTDGGGLDMVAIGPEKMDAESDELFGKLVDIYSSKGLLQSLILAGAIIKPVKKAGKFHLYKIQGMFELWNGAIEGEWSYRAGYVANPDNLDIAVDAANEEIRCLMAEI